MIYVYLSPHLLSWVIRSSSSLSVAMRISLASFSSTVDPSLFSRSFLSATAASSEESFSSSADLCAARSLFVLSSAPSSSLILDLEEAPASESSASRTLMRASSSLHLKRRFRKFLSFFYTVLIRVMNIFISGED